MVESQSVKCLGRQSVDHIPSSNLSPFPSMEQGTLINVNNCLNTKIYPHFETSGGQSSKLYLDIVNFFNTRVNKTSVAA